MSCSQTDLNSKSPRQPPVSFLNMVIYLILKTESFSAWSSGVVLSSLKNCTHRTNNPINFISICFALITWYTYVKNSTISVTHWILELRYPRCWGVLRSTCWGARAQCCCFGFALPNPPTRAAKVLMVTPPHRCWQFLCIFRHQNWWGKISWPNPQEIK